MSDRIPQTDYPKLKVIALLFIGLSTFGAAPILVRYATDVQPMVLAAMRTLFAVIILLPFWLPKKKSVRELKSAGISTFMMMLAGFSLGLHFTFWVASLHYTSVASASVLVTIHPVMLIVAERFVFKKKFSGIIWFGVFIACLGSVMLGLTDHAGGEEFENPLLGNILAFSAAVIFVLYFMIGRKLRQKAEWIDYVFYVYSSAAVTCIVLTFIWVGGIPYISLTALIVGVALAAGPTIIGHGSMNYAVKYVSPTLLSTLILSEAIFAAIAAYFIFDEIPSMLSIGAMFVILKGVAFTWSRRVSKREADLQT